MNQSLGWRLLDAAISGLTFALIIWGLWSLGWSVPEWSHHHLTGVLLWTGAAYACGSFMSKRQIERVKRGQL